MNTSRLLGAVCTCLTFVSFSASAALVDLINIDLKIAGDELITRDSNSGLDWLDLTETNGLSQNYILTQMGSGGLFDGWRYATFF
jgi:hypothetical protein